MRRGAAAHAPLESWELINPAAVLPPTHSAASPDGGESRCEEVPAPT